MLATYGLLASVVATALWSGLLLTLTLIVVGRIDQFQWLIFVFGAVAIAVIFGVRWLLPGGRSPWRASTAPSPSAALGAERPQTPGPSGS